MIAIDTNVLVRYLVADEGEQRARARRLIRGAVADGAPVLVPTVVLVETAWVLTSSYRFGKAQLLGILEGLVHSAQVEIEDHEVAASALDAFRKGGGDFADYVVREAARHSGCDTVATFDKALLKEDGFVAP